MRILKKYFVTIIALILMLIPVIVYCAGSQQASSLTGQNVVDRAREYLKESTASFYTDAQMLIWVNNGIMDIAGRTGCLEFEENITLVSGTLEYTLSTSYIGIYAAKYTDGTYFTGLIPGRIEDIGKKTDVVTPVFYYEANGKIGIYPVCGADAAGDTVTVTGYERPTAIALGGTNPLPALYDHLLIYYVVGQGLYKKGKLNEANVFMTQYYQGLDSFRLNYVVSQYDKEHAK